MVYLVTVIPFIPSMCRAFERHYISFRKYHEPFFFVTHFCFFLSFSLLVSTVFLRFLRFSCLVYLFSLSARHWAQCTYITTTAYWFTMYNILNTDVSNSWWLSHIVSAKNLWIFWLIYLACLPNKSSTYRITIFYLVGVWLDCKL